MVLLGVVAPAKTQRPAVRWFERFSPVGAAPHMGAFDRKIHAPGDRASMPPDPGAMAWTRARLAGARRPLDFSGKPEPKHGQAPTSQPLALPAPPLGQFAP